MERELSEFDFQIVIRFEFLDTPGDEVAPGSNEIGKDFKNKWISHGRLLIFLCSNRSRRSKRSKGSRDSTSKIPKHPTIDCMVVVAGKSKGLFVSKRQGKAVRKLTLR